MAYRSQHTMLEALVNILLAAQPCAEINLIQSPSYTITDNRGGGAYWEVECLKPLVAGSDFVMTFNQPTLREDGTVLDGNDIKSYRIEKIGGCFSAVTIDKAGLESKQALSCLGE